MDARSDHEHDEQQEERDRRRHVFLFSPRRTRAGAMRPSLLALRERARRVAFAFVGAHATDTTLDPVLADASAVVIAR